MTDSTSEKDRIRITEAARLAWLCPPSNEAFSVGAIIFDAMGRELSRGYSRESDLVVHAEESARAKLNPHDVRLRTATLYSSLEPCSERASRPLSCTRLILNAGIPRVVIAWREPNTFVTGCRGSDILKEHGVEVLEMSEMAWLAMEPNRHLLRIRKGR